MNESQFIELLNLYVDQEISREDSLLLEQEIARNPARRKVYLQYCRIHRASRVLAESFKADQIPSASKLARAARSAEAKMAREPGRSWMPSWGWMSAGGLVAAAAAVALVVVIHDTKPTDELHQNANVALGIRPVMARKIEGPKQEVAVSSQPRSVSTSTMLQKAAPVPSQPVQFASDPSLDWMKSLSLPKVQTLSPKDLEFEAKQMAPTETSIQPSSNGRVEMTAFQFQR